MHILTPRIGSTGSLFISHKWKTEHKIKSYS